MMPRTRSHARLAAGVATAFALALFSGVDVPAQPSALDKDFHNFVLGLGTVPLDVLGREVEGYIRGRA
jgi:hypothetical protein